MAPSLLPFSFTNYIPVCQSAHVFVKLEETARLHRLLSSNGIGTGRLKKKQCQHLSAIVRVSRLRAVNKHTVVQALTNCRNNENLFYSLANTAVVERPRLAMKGLTVLKSAEAPLKVAILMMEDNLDSPQRRTFAWEIIRHCRVYPTFDLWIAALLILLLLNTYRVPGEIKRREMELDPQVSPEEIMNREVELGFESWTSFASGLFLESTAAVRSGYRWLCPARQLKHWVGSAH